MVVTKYVCNYAVARFMPYAETEEFVCIGVVLICPITGYFGYRLENKRRDRVTGFFPELAPDVFIRGRRIFEQHLQHAHRLLLAGKKMRKQRWVLNGWIRIRFSVSSFARVSRFSGLALWARCWL